VLFDKLFNAALQFEEDLFAGGLFGCGNTNHF
jgi:hypothetical protein